MRKRHQNDAGYGALEKDRDGNALVGQSYVFNGHNNLVHSNEKLTVVSSIDDAIVITTPAAVLVMRRGNSEKIKTLIENLKANKLI